AHAPLQKAAQDREVFYKAFDLEDGCARGWALGRAHSFTSQQATVWPPPAPTKGGGVARQRSVASSQRAAKAQPTIGLVRIGTRPGISCRRGRAPAAAASTSSRGIARIRPRVQGCNGLSNSASTGASSTLRPAYMTTTRSVVSATTPRSW